MVAYVWPHPPSDKGKTERWSVYEGLAWIVLCDVNSNLCNVCKFVYFPRRRRACFSKQTVQRIIVYCCVLDILSCLFAIQWMNSSIYCVLKRLRKLTGERFLVTSNKKTAFDVQVAPANLDFDVYTLFSSTFVAILSLRFFLCRGEGASCMAYKYRKFRVVIQVLLYVISINIEQVWLRVQSEANFWFIDRLLSGANPLL